MGKTRSDVVINFGAYLVILIVLIFALFPLVWMFLTSLKPESDIITAQLQYLPRRLTFENYVNIWNRSGFPALIWNSVKTTAITLVICITLGAHAAYAVSRYRFRWRSRLLLLYLVIRMFPVVLLIIPLFIMLRDLKVLDTAFGLALAYSTFLLPLCVWMLKGFFDSVPPDLEDAARIDGCTRLGAFWRIVIPLVRSGLVATTVFIGISSWNEYLFALMLTTSQNSRTWPIGLKLMIGEFQLPWGAFSAAGVLTIIPVFVFFTIVQQSLVRGISAGAMKG